MTHEAESEKLITKPKAQSKFAGLVHDSDLPKILESPVRPSYKHRQQAATYIRHLELSVHELEKQHHEDTQQLSGVHAGTHCIVEKLRLHNLRAYLAGGRTYNPGWVENEISAMLLAAKETE